MANGVAEESDIKSWNPLGFIDYVLDDWFALPSPRELLPSPGDIARNVIGSDKTLDAVGRKVRGELDSAAARAKP